MYDKGHEGQVGPLNSKGIHELVDPSCDCSFERFQTTRKSFSRTTPTTSPEKSVVMAVVAPAIEEMDILS